MRCVFCFDFPRPVPCAPDGASVSVLSIFVPPLFGFLERLFASKLLTCCVINLFESAHPYCLVDMHCFSAIKQSE